MTTVATKPPRTFGAILRDHLDNELAAHRVLLATAEALGAAVRANDRTAFAEALAREEAQGAEAGRLRQGRERILRGIAERLGVPAPLRLSAIIAKLGDDAAGIEERRQELIALAGALQRQNDRNQALLRTCAEVVGGVLRLIAGEEPAATAYDRRGRQAAGVGGGIVDLKG